MGWVEPPALGVTVRDLNHGKLPLGGGQLLGGEDVEKVLGLGKVEHIVVNNVVIDGRNDTQRLLARMHLQESLLGVQQLKYYEVWAEEPAQYHCIGSILSFQLDVQGLKRRTLDHSQLLARILN